jgi:hypothetical protein
MSNNLTIHFGPFVLTFTTISKIIGNQLQHIFTGYECGQPCDFTVHVIPSDKMPTPVTLPDTQWIPLTVQGQSFEVGPQFIAGTVNLAHREISIAIHSDFFNFPVAEIFQSFLYRLYYTLCEHRAIESCFIHGCGVLKEETAYLFIGPHQSGKTTVGKTSGAMVIHDDQILISRVGSRFTMDSPPLPVRDNLRCHPETAHSIQRIFMIIKDSAFGLHSVSADAAFAALYREVVIPLTLTSNDENASRRKKAIYCLELLKKLNYFELHFDKEGAFWKDLLQRPWEQLHDQQHR